MLRKLLERLTGRAADAPVTVDANELVREGDRYQIAAEGRASCVSSKRTLFNKDAREQLEGAAAIFATA